MNMNLVVIDKCTNYCKYCFASNEMAKNTAKNFLRESDFEYIKTFIQDSGDNFTLNIIGGEPFLYRYLDKLLRELLSLKNLQSICILTGGIASKSQLERVLEFDSQKISFLFNINEKKDYRHFREYQLVLDNVDLILSKGFKVGFGYNIYENEFNYQEIVALCLEYGIPALRWTVAFPELNYNPLTKTLKPNDYKNISKRVFNFLEAAYQAGIIAYLDCPIPKCFFSYEELGRIALIQPQIINAIRSCGPVIDVSPDLDVFRCYALSELKRTNLRYFKNIKEVAAFYEKNVDNLYTIPTVFSYCSTCEFALNRTCYGGCIAHSPNSVGKRKPKEEIIEQLFNSLNASIEDIEQIFKENFGILKDEPLYYYLLSFVEERESNIARCKTLLRKSILLSVSLENTVIFTKRYLEIKEKYQNEITTI